MADKPVKEIIERDESRLVQVSPDEPVRRAVSVMSERKCGSVVVIEEGRLVGIFTERDLVTRVAALGKSLDDTPLHEVMTRDPDTIGANDSVKTAIRMMDQSSYRYLPVIEDGRVIGVLSGRHLPFADVIGMGWEISERHTLAERMR